MLLHLLCTGTRRKWTGRKWRGGRGQDGKLAERNRGNTDKLTGTPTIRIKGFISE